MAKKGKKEEDTGSSDLDTDEESECSIKSKDFVEKEMVKKKQAMLTQFLQDKLLKEERYGVINLYKLTEKWRTVFRQMRSKELQQDIVLLSCHIQRVMEQKDTIIKGLLCELDEANDYLAPVLCSYMQCINQHLESQKGMVALLEHRWTEMLQEISADLEVDKSLIACQHKERCMRMEELNFAFDQYYNDIETEERQDFQSVYSDLQCKTSEERDALRLSLENNVEVAWHKARDTLWDYNESTLESYAGIQLLMDEDQQLVDEIEDDVLMIKELQDSIVVFRSKVHKAANRPKGSLQKVKDEVDAEAEIIKTEMSTSRSRDRNYLTILVSQIDGARKKLQALILKPTLEDGRLSWQIEIWDFDQDTHTSSISARFNHLRCSIPIVALELCFAWTEDCPPAGPLTPLPTPWFSHECSNPSPDLESMGSRVGEILFP